MITSDSTRLTHVLLVTSTVRMVHRVHGHTSDKLGPLVSLHSVLVEGTTRLQEYWLVSTSTAGNQTNHSSATVRDGLILRAAGGRKSNYFGDALVGILGHNNGIVTRRGSGKFTTISNLGLNVANNSTLGDLTHRKDVSDGQSSYKTMKMSPTLTQNQLKQANYLPFFPANTN